VKGAEIVRMIHGVIGAQAFRAGADLYFARHDGRGATCEDFLRAMEDASGRDLGGFLRWYQTEGTPRLCAVLSHEPAARRVTLALTVDLPVPVPLQVALFGSESGIRLAERLVLFEGADEVVFENIAERPVLSINRGFSAPVAIEAQRGIADLALLAIHDDDPFARHEAMQLLMVETLRARAQGGEADFAIVVEAIRHALADDELERGLVAELASLPPEGLIGEAMERIDPGTIHAASNALRAELSRALEREWRAAQAAAADDGNSAAAKGVRRLRSVALGYLLAGGVTDGGALALRQFEQAETMTDREGALRALADSAAPERERALAAFHTRYRHDARLLDKWFAVQAGSARFDTIEIAPRLLAHPDFTLAHPGRLGAIVGSFAATAHAFHDPSGRGYRFLADVAMVADRSDPAAGVRMVQALAGWRRFEPARSELMRAQLERIAATPGVSSALGASVSTGLV